MQTTNNKSSNNLIKTNALIEQHIHGGFGIDFAVCDVEDFLEFSKKIIEYGVCGFFPTLATDSIENLKRQILRIKEAMSLQTESFQPMAKILGVHLEACFLNPEKKGIHDENQLMKPTIDNYKLLEDDIIKIVTLAPELDNNFELCKYLKSKKVRVSAGHCIGYDLSCVDQVTHLYNAMGAFSHRGGSTVVEALANENIVVELIADFMHVQKDVLSITFKTKSLDKVVLISDALPIAHSEKKSMQFCGKEVFLKDNKAVDVNGTMAGSTSFVYDIVKKLVRENMLTLEQAVAMASDNAYLYENCQSYLYWDSDLNIVGISLFGNNIKFQDIVKF